MKEEEEEKEESLKSIFWDNAIGYCEHATVHGFAYLPDEITNCGEKIFWGIIIVIGIT